MLDTVLGPWDISVNKVEKDSCCDGSYILVGGERETIRNKHSKLYAMTKDMERRKS